MVNGVETSAPTAPHRHRNFTIRDLSDEMIQIEPLSATQSTVYEDNVATNAIDGDPLTWSHTLCEWDTDIWLKIKFIGVHCFTEIKLLDRYKNSYVYRKNNGKVFVINKASSQESLCGIIKIDGDTYDTYP